MPVPGPPRGGGGLGKGGGAFVVFCLLDITVKSHSALELFGIVRLWANELVSASEGQLFNVTVNAEGLELERQQKEQTKKKTLCFFYGQNVRDDLLFKVCTIDRVHVAMYK